MLAVTTGALAAGLLTGAALALLGLQVTPAPTGPDPATALRAVQRLGTVGPGPQSLSVTFTMDAGSGLPGFSNTFTYRAVGTDAASVDLTQLGPADVRLHGHAASVRIPSAHLDPPVVDDSSSGVVRHDEGLFTGLLENGDVNPSDLRSAASSHLSDQAQQRGLPEAAQRLAGDQVRAALRPLGITSVAVSYAA